MTGMTKARVWRSGTLWYAAIPDQPGLAVTPYWGLALRAAIAMTRQLRARNAWLN